MEVVEDSLDAVVMDTYEGLTKGLDIVEDSLDTVENGLC